MIFIAIPEKTKKVFNIIKEFQKAYPGIDYELLHRIVTKELDVPAYRKIGIAMRSRKAASLAVKRFLEYLHYR